MINGIITKRMLTTTDYGKNAVKKREVKKTNRFINIQLVRLLVSWFFVWLIKEMSLGVGFLGQRDDMTVDM